MIEALILWKLWDDKDPDDNRGHGTILIAIFGQLVLWPLSLAYVLKTYLNLPTWRALVASAVVTVWLLWLFPLGFAIAGIITTLIVAWIILERLDII